MPRQETRELTEELAEAARRLEAADSLEALRDSLSTERRLWHLFRQRIHVPCEKSGELARLADFVLATLKDGGLPDDRAIATLARVNLRATALLGQTCAQECPTPRQVAPALCAMEA